MLSRRILSLVLLCGLSSFLWGQRCGFTDTIAIGGQGITNVTVDIADYLNNDLANAGQGLCGVSVFFQHAYVYDLTLTVTSPAGQSVELIGPLNAQTRPPTNLARWFIDFDPCASPTAPDAGASGQWNNNFPFNWPAFGLFQGDYHPAAGCLEDFNTGPVNGQWTFRFNTERLNLQDRVTYLLLEFCDDRNAQGPCCNAYAGDIRPIPNLEFCEATPQLPLSIVPRFARPRADPTEYDYTFVIARNDSILLTQNNPDLGGLTAGRYEICGLSYRAGELGLLPLDGRLSPADLRADFASVTPTFCGDLTPICQTVNLYPIPETTFLERTICRGGSVTIGNTQYLTTNIHTTRLVGRAGCDSTVVLDLRVVDEFRTSIDTTICSEAFYQQGANTYFTPGTYVDTIPSRLGCDSILTLQLRFAPPIVADTAVAICAGDTYFIGSEGFTAGGRYTRTIPAVNGCDSTVTVNLIVLDPQIRFAPRPAGLTCDNPTIELNASGSTFAFINRGVWTDEAGNDLGFLRRYTVTTGGRYFYELTNQTLGVGCTVRDSVRVQDFRIDVRADLALTQVQCDGAAERCKLISCRNPSLGIEATIFPAGPAYRYEWTAPPGGNIVGATNGREIIVDAPGNYRLRVEDDLTGCFLDTTYLISLDTITPIAAISGNQLLNCATTELRLTADTLQANPDSLDYVWTGACLPSPVQGPLLTLDCPGLLTLTVTNRISGCSAVTSIVVAQDIAPSNLSLAPATAPLSCFFPERLLDASASTSANGQEFYWTYGGQPDTIGTASTYRANRAGVYFLTAVDRRSRCSSRDSIFVPADTLAPIADSGRDTLTLNCYTPSLLLGGNTTSQGPEFQYSWVRAGLPNDTLGRAPTLTVTQQGGLFRLAVRNLRNGCLTEGLTRVLNQLDTPRIRIDPPLQFECFIDSVALDARATNLNYDNVTNWTGPCLAPARDTNLTYAYCPGTYFYSVINEESGCRSRDSVEILLGANSVVAILPDTAWLDCETGATRIDRSQGTDAPVVRWFRDTVEVLLAGQRPRVTVPGLYTLVLGNFNESCLDTARIVVTANCPALAIVVPPDSITCNNPAVDLDASVSFPDYGPDVATEWLIPAGAITLAGADERRLQVFSPGTYGFVVRNLISLDTDTTYVVVAENTISPIADAGRRDTVNCYNRTVTLDGSGSSVGEVYDYRWSNSADDTLSDSLTADVTAGGIYLFEVTQRVTGCSAIDNVRIIADLDAPSFSFTSAVIPCDTVDFDLAVIADPGEEYVYEWIGPNILADADNDTVRISDVGIYSAKVTRLDNGCATSDVVLATRLPCPPFPLLADTSLSCLADDVLISASFRDPCQGCTYTWRRDDVVVPGETGTALRVRLAGEYEIVVINEFGLIGTARATVSDSRLVPSDNAGPDQTLTCSVTDALLWNPAPEPDFNFSYRWLDPAGNTVGGDADSLRVFRGGRYQLFSTNLFSNCTIVDTVVVRYDTLKPVANAGTGRLLDCNNKRRVLDGINSSLGRDLVYRWSGGPSVACLEGVNTLNPLVRCGGDYVLFALDTINGCSDTAVVTVDVDEALPIVIPLPDTSLNCRQDTLLLVGEDISRPNIEYGWEAVSPGGNTPLPEVAPGVLEVTAAGRFRFFIRDTVNGCDNDFTLGVTADLDIPTVQTSASDTFFCELDSLLISGSGAIATGIEPDYRWASATGFFINNSTEELATIFQPDTYYFTVSNPLNFCSATDSVVIFRDVRAPIAEAGRDTTLTCSRRQVQLFGSGTTNSGEQIFSWTTRDGGVLSGAATARPFVNRTGTYLFTIVDPQNSCSGADIVRVTEDTIRPQAGITAANLLLNCNRPEIILRGRTVSAGGGSLSGRWIGPRNLVLNGPAELPQLPVTASGRYRYVLSSARNGCRDTAAVVVTEDFVAPAITQLRPPTLSCNRDSVRLQIAPVDPLLNYRYQWRNERDSLLGRASGQFVYEEGPYTLIAENPFNGCRDTTQTIVTGNFVAPEVVITPPEVLNCFRNLAAIDGTTSTQGREFTATWAGPPLGVIASDDPYLIRGREPGAYTLTVRNEENGCVTADTVELFREAVLIEGLELELDQPACVADRDGEVVVVGVAGGTAPFRFRLDGGLLTDRMVYEGLPVGRYNLEVVGADGCSTDTDFEILEGVEPEVRLRSDTLINLGDSILLDFSTSFANFDTLLWTSSGPLPALVADGPIWVRPLASQTYRLVVQNEEGCRATASVVIEVNGQVDVYVPTAFSPDGNDNNDLFRPYAGSQVQSIRVFKVFDRWGELLYDITTDPLRGSEVYGWDGRLRGKLMDSQVFIWQMEVELIDDTIVRLFGDFVLMR